ncbi:MAG: hypothetical protein PVI35_05860 [Acidimicrobiia bacterium]|jgi:hypothetical protein
MDDTRSGSEAGSDPVKALEEMDPAEAVEAAERHAADLAARLEGVVGRPGEADGAAGDAAGSGEAGEGPGT